MQTKALVIECIKKCLELNEIPGNSRKECGNYLEHDLQGAKKLLEDYLSVIM